MIYLKWLALCLLDWVMHVTLLVAPTPTVLVNQSGDRIPFTKQVTGCYAYTRTNISALCSIASIGQFVSSDASAGVLDVVAIGRWY